MKLVAISMIRDEEYWIWYALTAAYPHVDRLLVFDNHSSDRSVEIVHSMPHIADKLELVTGFGGDSEQENREACLEAARNVGGTHVLFLDGDEVHNDRDLGFARQILEVSEHEPGLTDPPCNDSTPGSHVPTEGILVKNIGFKPVHPGFAGPRTSIPQDLSQPDSDHGCYNFAIRIASLANLHGNGLEWGQHGYLETGDRYIQSSAQTLWCPRLFYHHFTHHERSPARGQKGGNWTRQARDLGSVQPREGVIVPEVLFRPDGPSNPTLRLWGLRT